MGIPSNDLNISQAGYVVFDGVSTFTGRTFQAGTGISLTNASGVAGNTTITATGPTTDLHVAKFIVSAEGTVGTGANFTTITAAIASAVGTGINSTIFIMPGTYTENFTLPAGINLTAYSCDAFTPNVTIVGNITCTGAGSRSISGIRLQTNSAAFLTVSANAAIVVNLIHCYLNCTNNTGITYSSASSSSAINVYFCKGDLGTTGIGLFAHSSAGTLYFQNCVQFTNSGGSTTSSTISSGILAMQVLYFLFPITSSGTSIVGGDWVNISTDSLNITALTAGGSGGHTFNHSTFASGTATSISVSNNIILNGCVINSSNAAVISGAGTISYSSLFFSSTGSNISVTTQTPRPSSNDALVVKTPGAYPYTTVPQDAVILVDSSAARTITPLASPNTGQRHIIKDSVGSAAANNITITPSGKNIDGAASYVITTNYGSVTIIYNGSEWSVT
jgi:hypothetical protein